MQLLDWMAAQLDRLLANATVRLLRLLGPVRDLADGTVVWIYRFFAVMLVGLLVPIFLDEHKHGASVAAICLIINGFLWGIISVRLTLAAAGLDLAEGFIPDSIRRDISFLNPVPAAEAAAKAKADDKAGKAKGEKKDEKPDQGPSSDSLAVRAFTVLARAGAWPLTLLLPPIFLPVSDFPYLYLSLLALMVILIIALAGTDGTTRKNAGNALVRIAMAGVILLISLMLVGKVIENYGPAYRYVNSWRSDNLASLAEAKSDKEFMAKRQEAIDGLEAKLEPTRSKLLAGQAVSKEEKKEFDKNKEEITRLEQFRSKDDFDRWYSASTNSPGGLGAPSAPLELWDSFLDVHPVLQAAVIVIAWLILFTLLMALISLILSRSKVLGTMVGFVVAFVLIHGLVSYLPMHFLGRVAAHTRSEGFVNAGALTLADPWYSTGFAVAERGHYVIEVHGYRVTDELGRYDYTKPTGAALPKLAGELYARDLPHLAVIGKVGETVFLIGGSERIEAEIVGTGTLHLSVNQTRLGLGKMIGGFRYHIRRIR